MIIISTAMNQTRLNNIISNLPSIPHTDIDALVEKRKERKMREFSSS